MARPRVPYALLIAATMLSCSKSNDSGVSCDRDPPLTYGNFGKGFVLGVGAKGVHGALYGLLSLARGRRPALGALFGTGGLDYGMYFGSVLSTYNTIMYVTRFETGVLHHFRGALAGALAGALSSGLAPAGHRHDRHATDHSDQHIHFAGACIP